MPLALYLGIFCRLVRQISTGSHSLTVVTHPRAVDDKRGKSEEAVEGHIDIAIRFRLGSYHGLDGSV